LHPNYALSQPEGAFYAFPRLPRDQRGVQVASDVFIEAAIEKKVLIVPGKAFSAQDTHFRLSFAASDEHLAAGISVLNELAERFSS
jgi:aspartate/methionine/tyrosine aminotransferase